jgi:hypothetical protein
MQAELAADEPIKWSQACKVADHSDHLSNLAFLQFKYDQKEEIF